MPENIDEIINRIRSNNEQENRKLAGELTENLSNEQKSMLDKLMNDKTMLQKILNNEKIREIMNKIGGESNGYK